MDIKTLRELIKKAAEPKVVVWETCLDKDVLKARDLALVARREIAKPVAKKTIAESMPSLEEADNVLEAAEKLVADNTLEIHFVCQSSEDWAKAVANIIVEDARSKMENRNIDIKKLYEGQVEALKSTYSKVVFGGKAVRMPWDDVVVLLTFQDVDKLFQLIQETQNARGIVRGPLQ